MRLRTLRELLSFGLVTSPWAVRGQMTAHPTARVEIQAQYDRMARAIEAKDVAGVTRLFSPLDTAAEDQAPWWRAAFAKTRGARLVITVDTVAVRGDTARVAYTEHDTITTGTVSAPHVTAVTLHEVAWWVRGPTGWLHQAYVSAALPVRVRDGVPLPPTRADSTKLAVGMAETRRRSWP